jgi:hypothetical protein
VRSEGVIALLLAAAISACGQEDGPQSPAPGNEKREYRPGGERFAAAWEHFYVLAFHEPKIDDSLIAAGPEMAPYIAQAVMHRDMKRRRYAVGALGCIGDARVMPTLVELASDEAEVSVIRGDAIESIYLIESQLGKQYARQYRGDHEYLDHIASRILSDDTYFRESCEF